VNHALLPLLLTAAGLLVASGVAKLRDPLPAASALAELGVPKARSVACVGAVLELLVAGLMVLRPTVGAPIAAAMYVAFAALLVVQLRAGITRSCGCLGSAETPPSRVHVAVDLALAGVCGACAVTPPAPLEALTHPAGVIVWSAAAVTAWALVAALELLPRTLTAYKRPAA
jgi:hypothetical protein